jgi:rhodanese-related sulfurtransferase
LAKAWWKFGAPRLAMAAVVLSFGLSQVFAQILAQDAPMQIEGAKTLNSKGVIELISTTPDVVIIDNRTKADFDSGHIEGAVNIVDTSMTVESSFAGVVKSKAAPVLFYCNGIKCGRAAKATARAVGWGYSRVYYYALGIPDWKANQFPLVTP